METIRTLNKLNERKKMKWKTKKNTLTVFNHKLMGKNEQEKSTTKKNNSFILQQMNLKIKIKKKMKRTITN